MQNLQNDLKKALLRDEKLFVEGEQGGITEQKRFLIEVLDENLLNVNYSEIDDTDFEVSEEDKKLNHAFYKLKK
jgi:adenine-specific DNA-methyltransferase